MLRQPKLRMQSLRRSLRIRRPRNQPKLLLRSREQREKACTILQVGVAEDEFDMVYDTAAAKSTTHEGTVISGYVPGTSVLSSGSGFLPADLGEV